MKQTQRLFLLLGVSVVIILAIWKFSHKIPQPSHVIEGKVLQHTPQQSGVVTGDMAKQTMVNTSVVTRASMVTQGTEVSAITVGKTVQHPPDVSEEIETFAQRILSQLKDTSIPLERRETIIKELAQSGEAEAISALKSAVNANIYLSLSAMEAIGDVRNDLYKGELTKFIRGYFTNEDSRMVCAALRSYAKISGSDAIPEIIDTIRVNKGRADGHSDMIAYTGVKLLGELYAINAIPFLREELKHATNASWNLEYGSKIVTALRLMGTPESKRVAGEYADILSSRIPADPLAREYFLTKIAEARDVANQ